MKPKRISIGDILIQYVSSQKEDEKQRIVGYYECVSNIQRAIDGKYPIYNGK